MLLNDCVLTTKVNWLQMKYRDVRVRWKWNS